MKYKALILDVDGTLIHHKRDAVPSKKVIEAVGEANKFLHVGIATARPISVLKILLEKIAFSGPSIINGGSQIIDLPSQKVLSQETLDIIYAQEIYVELKKITDKKIWFNSGNEDIAYDGNNVPGKIMQMYVEGLEPSEAELVVNKISLHFAKVAIYKAPSWQEKKIDILITSALATKQYGILRIAEILGISTHEIIGVGDGPNDFPLLMACGLKVAMGNASDELKEIADYVAPSVDKDGVADVINKFVLN